MEKIEKRKLETANDEGLSHENEMVDKRRRVIGPSLPLPKAPDRGSAESGSESESDGDDIGPALPPKDGSLPAIKEKEEELKVSTSKASQQNVESQRDNWMLQPPETTDWAARVDPTKLRSRKFQAGKSGKGPSGGQIDASWTETPDQKIRRLRDKVMGVDVSRTANSAEPSSQTSKVTEVARARIQKYNDATRKETSGGLMGASKDSIENDDPSLRSFDREKDMAISSRVTGDQRRDMLNRATDFGSRFTQGKFL